MLLGPKQQSWNFLRLHIWSIFYRAFSCAHYIQPYLLSLLPLGVQIKAALHALRNVQNLPMSGVPLTTNVTHDLPEARDKSVFDILDWLSSIFGFQVTYSWNLLLSIYFSINILHAVGLCYLLVISVNFVPGPFYRILQYLFQKVDERTQT